MNSVKDGVEIGEKVEKVMMQGGGGMRGNVMSFVMHAWNIST